MKTTIERIFETLSKEKVELKSEKIELGLIQDIESEISDAGKGARKGVDMIEAAKKPLENSLKQNENLLKKIKKTKKSAIELGANDILKKVQKFETQVDENIKTIDKILSNIY